jgi:hypothetical protein
MRKPTPGDKVYAPNRDEPIEVESVDADYVWCTWIEDGQKRRGVFNRKQLQKA